MRKIMIPRCYFTNPQHEGSSLELHNFSDASEMGYGSVSYLRITYPDGKIECSFVAGKSRNAPLRTVTIPRLELQAAVLEHVWIMLLERSGSLISEEYYSGPIQ
jgi:hypothetical protein